MAKSVKMADIAEKLGVSIVTVSKALNGKEGVGSTLRGDILRMAEEMGYEMKAVSDKKNSLVIGIINSYVYLQKGASFYWGLYEKILKHLVMEDNLGILEVINQQAQQEAIVPKLVKDKRIDGLIIMGSFPENYMKMISTLSIPIAMIDAYNADYNYDTVVSDGFYGMYTMTNYLLKQGHRRIAFIGSVGKIGIMTDRYYGYCKALREYNIPVTDDMVIPDSMETGRVEIPINTEILSKYTALACCCDYTACEAMRIVNNMGLKVPDDISIIGFDNYILSEVSPVKITTYEVNQSRMAAECVRHICERMVNPIKHREISTISGNIIFRESVKNINII